MAKTPNRKPRSKPTTALRFDDMASPTKIHPKNNLQFDSWACLRHPTEESDLTKGKDILEHLHEMSALVGEPLIMNMLMRKYDYQNSQDPKHLINAFLLEHDKKCYPPLWVLNGLAEIFCKHQMNLEGKSLDKYFGYGGRKGQPPIAVQTGYGIRDLRISIDILGLIHLLGYTTLQAAQKVAHCLEVDPEYYCLFMKVKKPLSYDTIDEKYRKVWKRRYFPLGTQMVTQMIDKWPDDKRKEFLARLS
ncbi:MAG: hypothetical protein IH977_06825 [Nitrospinae bacterium]|nr:hypothetical protein [Nitrospinota bacterium]